MYRTSYSRHFVDRFSENLQISDFMKIRAVGADGRMNKQADMTKEIVTFRKFENAPKMA
jgi:hypothetical protein